MAHQNHCSTSSLLLSVVCVANKFILFDSDNHRYIQNPVKHPTWSVLRKKLTALKPLTIVARHFVLHVYQGLEYISDVNSFSVVAVSIVYISSILVILQPPDKFP